MNIFFRILLTIYAFCLTIVSLITILITFRTSLFESIYSYIYYEVLQDNASRIIMFVIAMVFFILNLVYLLSGLRTDKDKKAVSKHTNIGEIKISLDSIENIALTASRKLAGVKDSKAAVIKHEDNVSIILRIIVFPDVNIPGLSEDIQIKVKSSIEESSGIGVKDVRIIVENIHTGFSKPRVE